MKKLTQKPQKAKNKFPKMYNEVDFIRPYEGENLFGFPLEEYRHDFSRDLSRVIHSPGFRRLQGKTQLFPGRESDFFRNRLTHSLEVAQIARSICYRLNFIIEQKHKGKVNKGSLIDPNLVEMAALCHDIGHPPFGHQGEEALDEIMKDAGGFEGNGQTLRMLTKIEKKVRDSKSDEQGFLGFNDYRFGLNLTYRSIASFVKYDYCIPQNYKDREANKKLKGYYLEERDLISRIKDAYRISNTGKLKTVEMQIMDIADDIAYSVYDFEDSLKGGFIKLFDVLSFKEELANEIIKELNFGKSSNEVKLDIEKVKDSISSIIDLVIPDMKIDLSSEKKIESSQNNQIVRKILEITYNLTKKFENNAYYRNQLTSKLVGSFIRSISIRYNFENPMLSEVYFDEALPSDNADNILPNAKQIINILKKFTYKFQISSNKLGIVENRGKEIVTSMFNEIEKSEGKYLPFDFYKMYKSINDSNETPTKKEYAKKRIICDFISCMTDRYAFEYYGRLKSENPQTIFKYIH